MLTLSFASIKAEVLFLGTVAAGAFLKKKKERSFNVQDAQSRALIA